MSALKTIVISAINLFEGGTLTVLIDQLSFAQAHLSHDFKVIALVHKTEILPLEKFDKIEFIEFPESRKSYIKRLYFEYVYFRKLSFALKPYLWLSLHDITPNVHAEIRAVYCHNASPFRKATLSDLYFQAPIFLFTLFYKFLYQINIKKNDYVIVQQIWLKRAFVNMFGLESKKVLVCYPDSKTVNESFPERQIAIRDRDHHTPFTFFYPSLPRPYKNFELIGEAVKKILKTGMTNFQVIITVGGDENNYARYLKKKYGSLPQIKFKGLLSLKEVHEIYGVSDALLFPSTLESWGLPLTEYKAYGKPVIAADLPYAYETLGDYDKALYVDPSDSAALSMNMIQLINNIASFNSSKKTQSHEENILYGWKALYNVLLKTYTI